VFPSDLNQRSLAQSDLAPELVSKRYTKVPRQSITRQRWVQAFGERFSFLEEIQKNKFSMRFLFRTRLRTAREEMKKPEIPKFRKYKTRWKMDESLKFFSN
jgi:hypothetical protein